MDCTNLSSKSSHGVIPLGTKAANEDSSSEIGSLDEQPFNGELDLEPSIFKLGMPLEDDVVVRAAGSYMYLLYTASGKSLLDWTSDQMSSILGHCHPDVTKTISHHAAHLDHVYSGMLSAPVVNLARSLTAELPEGPDKAFFLKTGTESNEAAI